MPCGVCRHLPSLTTGLTHHYTTNTTLIRTKYSKRYTKWYYIPWFIVMHIIYWTRILFLRIIQRFCLTLTLSQCLAYLASRYLIWNWHPKKGWFPLESNRRDSLHTSPLPTHTKPCLWPPNKVNNSFLKISVVSADHTYTAIWMYLWI